MYGDPAGAESLFSVTKCISIAALAIHFSVCAANALRLSTLSPSLLFSLFNAERWTLSYLSPLAPPGVGGGEKKKKSHFATQPPKLQVPTKIHR